MMGFSFPGRGQGALRLCRGRKRPPRGRRCSGKGRSAVWTGGPKRSGWILSLLKGLVGAEGVQGRPRGHSLLF